MILFMALLYLVAKHLVAKKKPRWWERGVWSFKRFAKMQHPSFLE